MSKTAIGIGVGAIALVGTIALVQAMPGSGSSKDAESAQAQDQTPQSRITMNQSPSSVGADRLADEPAVERREIPERDGARPDGPRRRGSGEGPDDQRRADWENMTPEEREAARRAQAEQWRQRMLDEYDLDGDGQLSEEERNIMRDEMRARGMQMARERMEEFWGGEIPLTDDELGRAMELFRRDMMGQFRELRQQADADGDGQISEEEGRLARQTAQDMFRQMGDQFINEYDLDRSGALDDLERQAAADALKYRIAVDDAYRSIDADRDGIATPAEIADFSSLIDARDVRADLNRDGSVDDADLNLFMEAAQQEPPPQMPQWDGRGGGNRGPGGMRRPGGGGDGGRGGGGGGGGRG